MSDEQRKSNSSKTKYIVIVLVSLVITLIIAGIIIINNIPAIRTMTNKYGTLVLNDESQIQEYMASWLEQKYNKKFKFVKIEKNKNSGAGGIGSYYWYLATFTDTQKNKDFEVYYSAKDGTIEDNYPKVLYSSEIEKDIKKIIDDNPKFIYKEYTAYNGVLVSYKNVEDCIVYRRLNEYVTSKQDYINKGGITFSAHVSIEKSSEDELTEDIYKFVTDLEKMNCGYSLNIEIIGGRVENGVKSTVVLVATSEEHTPKDRIRKNVINCLN